MSSDLAEGREAGEWASWPAIRSGGAAGAAPFRSLRLGIAVTVGRALWVGTTVMTLLWSHVWVGWTIEWCYALATVEREWDV